MHEKRRHLPVYVLSPGDVRVLENIFYAKHTEINTPPKPVLGIKRILLTTFKNMQD